MKLNTRTPLEVTFDVLATTRDPRAVDVLLYALDVEHPHVAQLAVRAILKRASPRGVVELIRRWQQWPEPLQQEVAETASAMHAAVKHCLTHGDAPLLCHLLAAFRVAKPLNRVGDVLQIFDSEDPDVQSAAAQTLRCLVDSIFDLTECSKHDDSGSQEEQEELEKTRRTVLVQLTNLLSREKPLPDVRPLVEAILVLGRPKDDAVDFVLTRADRQCKEAARELLLTSQHPGVMQLILDFLCQRYPPVKVFEAFSCRSDMSFVTYLLEWLPLPLPHTLAENLNQIEKVAWLTTADISVLKRIRPELHGKLAALIRALRLPTQTRIRLLELILRYGSVAGRNACSDVFSQLDATTSRDIVMGALSAGTPEVVAWALQNLQRLDISTWIDILLQSLEHPSPVVREAAQKELRHIDLHRILELTEHWDEDTCRRIGCLLLKVDPQVISKLRRELESPVQWRRLRAVEGAAAMELQRHIVDDLIEMLDDPSVAVRRTAIRALSAVPGEKVTAALRKLRSDPNRRVREAVAEALSVQTQLPQPART